MAQWCNPLTLQSGPVHMEASQPAYRAGPVGETAFILCSYEEIPARVPRKKLDKCQK